MKSLFKVFSAVFLLLLGVILLSNTSLSAENIEFANDDSGGTTQSDSDHDDTDEEENSGSTTNNTCTSCAPAAADGSTAITSGGGIGQVMLAVYENLGDFIKP